MQNPRLATLAASVATVGLIAAGALTIAGQDSAAQPPAPTRVVATAVADTITPTRSTTVPGVQPDAVGAERAAEIAVNQVGGGRVTAIERELEHGLIEWKVRVVRAGVAHEVRVAADSGTITRSDADRRAIPVPRADDHGFDDHGSGGHGSDDRGSDRHGRGSDDHGRGSDDRRGG